MATLPPEQCSYEFGPYRLNPVQGTLFDGTRKISLTPKAFQTLLVLVERRGEVVTKEELLNKVWPGTFVEEATLAQNIFTLRKQLQEDGAEAQYIETIPKRGYRFIATVRLDQHSTEPLSLQPINKVPLQVPVQSRTRVRSLWAVVVAATLLILGAAGYWFGRARVSRSERRRVMLVVLPVQNLTGDPAREYVSDGLTEEIIAQLGELSPQRLGVIARTSSMAYKGVEKTAGQIGRELRVDYLLECSVRGSGERLRVTVQLIRTRDETHLWAENYDRALGDVLSLQTAVAREVANRIRLTLSPEEQARLTHSRPVQPEVYDACLRGRFLWNKRTPETVASAEAYFQQALQMDPGYAPAYAGLADCYQVMMNLGKLPVSEGLPQARAAAIKALELDDTLAEAHTSLASIKGDFDWDWRGAEAEYRQALTLNLNYATAHHWYGEFLAGMGRFDEATNEIQKAAELDPLSPVIAVTLGQMFCRAGQCERGIEQLKRTLAIYPDFTEGHEALAEIYGHQGMYAQALSELAKEPQALRKHSMVLSGYVLARAGRKQEALDVLRQVKRDELQHIYYDSAVIYLALGDKDTPIASLEKARLNHDFFMAYFRSDFKLEGLRSDPRYADLCRRMNMPQ